MSQTDIASLGFSIDSNQAQTATQRLDSMRQAAVGAALAMQGLGAGSGQATRNFETFGNRIASLAARMQEMDASLQGVVARMNAMQTMLNGTARAANAFMTIREQSDALARSIGTTTTAMQGWVQQTGQLNLVSAQTTSALERVTAALTQQTAAGRELRTIMQGYGVQFGGASSPSAAPMILRQFVQRMEGYRQTERSIGTLQEVVGPLSTQDLATIGNRPYYSQATRERQRYEFRVQQRNAAMLHADSDARHYDDNMNQRYADYSWQTGNYFNAGKLTQSLPAPLVAWALNRLGEGVPKGPEPGGMIQGRREQTRIFDEIRKHGSREQQREAGILPHHTANPLAEPAETTALGRYFGRFGNGVYGALQSNINTRLHARYLNSDSWTNIGNWAQGLGWSVENLLGVYGGKTQADVPKPPLSPMEQIQQEGDRARMLATYGLTGGSGLASSTQLLMQLHAGSGVAFTAAQRTALRGTGLPLGALGQLTPAQARQRIHAAGGAFNLPAEQAALLTQAERMGNIGPSLLGLDVQSFLQMGAAAAPGQPSITAAHAYAVKHGISSPSDVTFLQQGSLLPPEAQVFGGSAASPAFPAALTRGLLEARHALARPAIAATMPTVLTSLMHYYQQPDVVRALGMTPEQSNLAAGSTYENLLGTTQLAQKSAANPSYPELVGTQMQKWVQSQPAGERAKASALWQFAQKNGIDTRPWAESGLSPGGVLSVLSTGRGAFTASQSRTFGRTWNNEQNTQITAVTQASQENIAAQGHIQAAIRQGSGAVAEATARWTAYATALNAGKSAADAQATAQASANEAISRNVTLARDQVEQQREHNQQLQLQAHMLDLAGNNPAALGSAAVEGGIAASTYTYAHSLASGMGASQRRSLIARYNQHLHQAAGMQGKIGGASILQNYAEDAAQRRALAHAAAARPDAQMLLTQQMQAERQFMQPIAQASAANDGGAALAAVMAQLTQVLQMVVSNQDSARAIQDYGQTRSLNLQAAVALHAATLPTGSAVARYQTNVGVVMQPQNLGDEKLFPNPLGFLSPQMAHKGATFTPAILAAAQAAGVPPQMIASYIANESSFNPAAKNGPWAGLGQFDKTTGTEAGLAIGKGVDERLNPVQSILAIGREMHLKMTRAHMTFNAADPNSYTRLGRLMGEQPTAATDRRYHQAAASVQNDAVLASDLALHPRAVATRDPGVGGEMTAADRNLTAQRAADNAQANRNQTFAINQLTARLIAAPGGPGAQSLAASSVINPAARENAPEDAARARAMTLMQLQYGSINALATLTNTNQMQAPLIGATAAGPGYAMLARAHMAGQESLLQYGPAAHPNAVQSQTLTQGALGAATGIANQVQHLNLGIAEFNRIIAAWHKGPAAAQTEQMLGGYRQFQATMHEILSKLSANDPARATITEALARTANTPAIARAYVGAQATAQVVASGNEQQNQMTFIKADMGAGLLANPYQKALARDQAAAQISLQKGADPSTVAAHLATQKQIDLMQQLDTEVNTVDSSFRGMGNTILGAFEVGITRANNFGAAMRQATLSVEDQLLKTLVNGPLLNLAQGLGNAAVTGIGNALFGSSSGSTGTQTTVSTSGGSATGSSVASGVGSTITSGLIGAAFRGLFSAFGLASGGVVDGGGSFGGTVLDRPTLLGGRSLTPSLSYAASGTVMAGEVGHEAVLPLKRMANGNLGVVSSGGSGHSININAPIVVNGGGGGKGGNGKMDSASMRSIQAQFETMFRSSVRNVLVDEQRAGGQLYQSINSAGTGYSVA